MTTEKKQNLKTGVENFKKVMSRFGEKCERRRRKVSYFLEELLIFICLTFVAVFAWIITLVFMNPMILWILGFICPKVVAKETHKWCKFFAEFGLELYWHKVKGVFEFLPWYARKHYINYEFGFNNASNKDQMRFFNEMTPKEQEAHIDRLCEENRELLWKEAPQWRAKIVESEKNLSCQKFEELLYPLNQKAIEAYILNHQTLRAELLVAMRNCLDSMQIEKQTRDSEKLLSDIKFLADKLSLHIKYNGAPEELLSDLGGCTPFVFDCVKNALEVYAYRQAVLEVSKYSEKDEWQKYCEFLAKKGENLPFEAQILMSQSMYRIYYAAGLKLDEKAIKHFICKDKGSRFGMAHEIFEHEAIAMTPAMQMLLFAKPAVYRLYREIEAKRMNTTH